MRIALVYNLKCTRTTPNKLLNNSGLAIYMTFICSRIHYGDSVYDQSYKLMLHEKLVSIQYNAVLTILGIIPGSSEQMLVQKTILILEHFQN